MALIGKIRSYSGLLIAIIGVGLAAFVLGDLFQYGPRQGGDARAQMILAEIDNTTISYPEFDERFNQHLESWKQQTGESSPGDQELFLIRQQVWEDIINEILLENELEKTGIDVTGEELLEMVVGSDPHPFIVQSFTDPQTGEFRAEEVRNFIQNIDMMEPQMRNQWLMLEQHIKNERREEKYKNIIERSYFVPDFFANVDYLGQNETADIQFIAQRYNTISDDDIEIGENDIKKAYKENKNQYRQEHTRDLEYVIIPVYPTEEDRREIKEDILELKEELQMVDDTERFVNAVSDERMDEQYYSKGELSSEIDSIMFNSPRGTTYGPYEQENAFVVAMLNDIQHRPDSMRASHILITYMGSMADQQQQIARDRTQAKQKADSLLDVVRNNPGELPQLAMQISDDPSAAMNQGDLDWFNDGEMIHEFNEAVANGSVGDIVKVETDYGFHIIHITDHSQTSKKVQVAKIIREIIPSNSTYRQVFREVSDFAALAREKGKDFENAAKEKGYSMREAEQLGKMDNNLPGVQEARQIIQWAFNEETKKGEISQIYDFEDLFVVAKLKNVRKEGVPTLDDIRDDMKRIAIRDKKFEIIAGKFEEKMKEHKSLEIVAKNLGLELNKAENLKFETSNLPGFGREPVVIGAAFALEENQISDPVKGNNAVFVIELTGKESVIAPDDLTNIRRQLQNTFNNRVANEVIEALKKNADIKDNRIRFY